MFLLEILTSMQQNILGPFQHQLVMHLYADSKIRQLCLRFVISQMNKCYKPKFRLILEEKIHY